jgi:coenzyme F420-dependent glucose-6-phosphate dehydrogenase
MAATQYWFSASHEMFAPSELLRQAVAAEEAGFDGAGCSDHLQPWWSGGHSGHAWVWLGAAGQATERVAIGTGVTPPLGYRYHPVIVAQAFMTLEEMFPGRTFLGVGSGEALNEVPLGIDWPPIGEQVGRMEEALEIITRLWEGETLDYEGRFFRTKQAVLHTRAEGRPKLYVSAFGPRAARIAGRWADGVWTLADPEQAPKVIDAYRSGAEDAGREPGEVILQAGFAWAESDEQALEGARVWKATVPDEFYVEDWHDPAEMQRHTEQNVSDEEFREGMLISSDPDVHLEKVRDIEKLGATVVCLQGMGAADPLGQIRMYGEKVLPALRAGG